MFVYCLKLTKKNTSIGKFKNLIQVDNVGGCTSVVPHKGHIYLSSYFVGGYIIRILKETVDSIDK
jgi:hypothetical protein